jgi:hypothetical protein
MYFLVDISGSMNQDVAGGTKWDAVSQALTGFLGDPSSADIGVGIGYFPKVITQAPVFCTVDSDCGTYGPCVGGFPIDVFGTPGRAFGNCEKADVCMVPEYSVPSVPIALPPNPGAVAADLGNQRPGGGTPTRPALEGAMQHATSWASQNPGRTVVVVLATDGEPTGCMTNTPQDVANIAAGALAGPQRIRTFVIGVGDSLQALNLVAQAGGTGEAFLVDTGGDVTRQFAAALDQIRGRAVPCSFAIDDNAEVDPQKVNLTYTADGSGMAQTILRTNDGTAATCAAEGGWYYDNPSDPGSVSVCEATCGAIVSGGNVDFQLGCETRVSPIF